MCHYRVPYIDVANSKSDVSIVVSVSSEVKPSVVPRFEDYHEEYEKQSNVAQFDSEVEEVHTLFDFFHHLLTDVHH